MNDDKGALIEKAPFAILPLLFSCVVYLMSALSNLSHCEFMLFVRTILKETQQLGQATSEKADEGGE